MTKRISLKTHAMTFMNIRSVFILFIGFSILAFTSYHAKTTSNNLTIDGKWFIEFTHNDIGQARTILQFDSDDKTFTAYSRKNADKDILGNWTSFLGRTFTKGMKNGSLLRIENGNFRETNDTLFLAGILISPMGSYNFKGHIVKNRLYATLRNKSRGHLGTIHGNRNIPNLPMEDYPKLFKDVTSLTDSKIYNREILQSKEWNTFTKEMLKTTTKVQDDLEMIFAFFYRAGKLPFSHFALMKPLEVEENNSQNKTQAKYLFLEEKNKETVYLKITSFLGTAQEVDSIFDVIRQKNYLNLIVDLRNNTGGNVESGMAFATNLIDSSVFGGIFLTQKWFNNHKGIPSIREYENFPHFTEANYDLIIEGIHKTEGLCLKIIPKNKVFSGKLYILTNKRTASTCEPIVYELQKQKRALIIGGTTAGAMLNGEMFDLMNGFKLFIPTADYYTSDGFKIDKNGVKPDIETKKEDALTVALNTIKS